jgi:acetylglutamate/LysW-gamma-L-alpha-aminoadipate kinase
MLVVKIGGASGVNIKNVCQDIVTLRCAGTSLVIVHGGSSETNALAEQLGHPSRFVTTASGHVSRVTDRRTLEIFMMATASLNRRLVEELQLFGVNAFGLSGIDGRVLEARRKDAIRIIENGRPRVIRDDWTGAPTRVNAELISALLAANTLPVVAPLGISSRGEALNVDGDRAAAAIAGAMRAETLILLTNTPGVLRKFPDESSVIARLSKEELNSSATFAQGRMLKKMLGAQEALAAGVRRVVVSDGRKANPISAALQGEGTIIE